MAKVLNIKDGKIFVNLGGCKMKYFIMSNHNGKRELTRKQAKFYLTEEFGEKRAEEILKNNEKFNITKYTYDVYSDVDIV